MFKKEDLLEFPKLEKNKAQKLFVTSLQNAHAGELAAAWAYWGHYKSLFVTDKAEKAEIKQIMDDELHHRQRIREMLTELGYEPRFSRECLMFCIGFSIGILCLFGGWFIPMYGAGKLESTNIFEYEVAARLAHLSRNEKYVDVLLSFGELEWDHELYFRTKTQSHYLSDWVTMWEFPPPKEAIKKHFEQWV